MTRLGFAARGLVVLCLFAFAAESRATVVVLHDLEEMTRRSEVIVHARVADQRVTREDGRIVTLTDVEVIDGLKGAKAGDVLTIYQVGGTLDGMRAWIEGAHEYQVGEEVVLFAVRHRDRVVSYGVGVGKFRVIYDGAFRRVVEDIHGVVEMKRGEAGDVRMQTPTPREFPSFERFQDEVRSFVAKGDLPRSMKLQRLEKKLHVKPDAKSHGGR